MDMGPPSEDFLAKERGGNGTFNYPDQGPASQVKRYDEGWHSRVLGVFESLFSKK